MPMSQWKSMAKLDPGRDYLALASSIPAKRFSSTLRMFRGASRVRTQLVRTEGVVGFSLLARPLRKQYATLSVWTDDDALAAFVGQDPHAEIMSSLAAEMGATKFERWSINGSDGLPSWDEALQRLA